jgi:hypothetical protein
MGATSCRIVRTGTGLKPLAEPMGDVRTPRRGPPYTLQISIDLFIKGRNIATNVVGPSLGCTDRLASVKGVV